MNYKTTQCNKKQKRLHRVLMESKIGRKLDKNEIVHHKDGDKTNNIIENLELMTRGEHLRIHPEIKEAATLAKQKYIIDYDLLFGMYVNQDMTANQISVLLNVPLYSVNSFIWKNKIKHKKEHILCCVCGDKARYKKDQLCSKCYHKIYFQRRKNEI